MRALEAYDCQSVLDVSDRTNITTAAEIDLSRGEDSVQSIANLATRDGLITFAGINSSQADQDAGKNEHLRSFDIRYPPRKKLKSEKPDGDETGTITPLGKRSFFRASSAAKKETYQRILRLSPAQKRESGSKRIGAIATGMAKESELVVFDATLAAPDAPDIITRISLPEKDEAADLDIAEIIPSEFSIVYCTDNDIYEQTLKYDFGAKKVEKTPAGPRRIHEMPSPDVPESIKTRPKFRSVRFLNGQNIITLVNKPNKSGAELRLYHMYPTGPAFMSLQKSLPKRMTQAVSMDVCALDVDKNGTQQIVVAVAGQDISIEVYTTNYQRNSGTFSPFKHYLTLREVHQHQMTKICFSPFHSPPRAPDVPSNTTEPGKQSSNQVSDSSAHPGPQYIRLASVTYGNTVVVDTFPLSPLDPKAKDSRYVLSHPSDEAWTQYTYILVISMVVLVTAFLLQSFVTGFANAGGGPYSLLPQRLREHLDTPIYVVNGYSRLERAGRSATSAVDEALPTQVPGAGRLRDFLATHLSSYGDASAQRKALIVSEGGETGLSMDVHPDREEYLKQDAKAKHWHELDEQQQAVWRERLVQAGEWVEGQGEKVLLGVLFSEYAGMVGQAARGVLA